MKKKEIKILKKNNKKKDSQNCYKKLEKENKLLKNQIKEKEEILKNIQLQYITIKNEFDFYQKKIESFTKIKEQEINEQKILGILPIIELFELSYKHMPKEFENNKWIEGFNMVSFKIKDFLRKNNIELIKTIGEKLNEEYHEVVGIKKIKEKNKKNEITDEVRKGYIIKYADKTKVLQISKVILGE